MIGQDESEGSPAQQAADVSARPFGGIQLFVGGVRVAPVESSRVRSLVAFLILHRDAPHSRQRLAFMLWPDSAEAQPRTNLRHLIHTLRQAMPELDRFLDITSTSVAWREDTMTWFDVSAFEVAQRGSDSPGISVPEEVVFLRQAIDLYRGDLLDGLYDDWVLDLREQFRDRYLMQLRRLAAALDAAGDHPEAVRLGRELLRCDPLREETYRFLMTALATSGDRSGAARVYHECVATLRRELRVEPSPAPNFFRRPFGPGWALVGDAGYSKDPITA
ncbi:MAG: BTAD domain-containing putative transcriptional regulator, partial [Ilumatobacteraceae bacterium]